MPTFLKRGTLPIVNDSSNGKSPRGGKCSNFPKTPREFFQFGQRCFPIRKHGALIPINS